MKICDIIAKWAEEIALATQTPRFIPPSPETIIPDETETERPDDTGSEPEEIEEIMPVDHIDLTNLRYSVVDHRLHDESGPVPFMASPNVGGRIQEHLLIVAHYTGAGTLASSVNHFRKAANKVSAHLLIDTSGTIVQCVPLDRIAWHCGASRWGDSHGVNEYSIGMEFVNWGKLTKRDGKYYSWAGTEINPDMWELIYAAHPLTGKKDWYQGYTQEALDSGFAAAQAIAKHYGISESAGHWEIAIPEGRKTDPGPLFPMEDFKRKIETA